MSKNKKIVISLLVIYLSFILYADRKKGVE